MKLNALLFLLLFLGILGCLSNNKNAIKPAVTYYIDSSTGDDNNSGLSETKAWKSLSRAKSEALNPGDSILLKRGQVWKETLSLQSSGTSDRPISIGTYGEGDFPIISGSVVLNNLNWRELSPSLWGASLPSDQKEEPAKIYLDGIAVSILLWRETQKELKAQGQWAWDSVGGGTIFIFSKGSPKKWGKRAEVNVLRYGVDLRKNNFIQIKEVDVQRSREGVVLGGNYCSLTNMSVKENTLNGVVVSGSNNRLEGVVSSYNGLDASSPKGKNQGNGFLISGANNEFKGFVAMNNREDGVHFSAKSGAGNLLTGGDIKTNGENCVDVKKGDQTISAGIFISDDVKSTDCILVHANPQHLVIDGTKVTSMTSSPALSIYDGGRVSVTQAQLQGGLSTAVYFDGTSGNQSSIFNTTIEKGGDKSKILVDIRGGKKHVLKGNILFVSKGVLPTKVAKDATVSLVQNKILTK